MRRLPAGLVLSTAVHAALVLGVLAAFGGTTPRMLFVDLVEGIGLGGEGSGGGGSSGEPAPADANQVARPAGEPRRSPPARRSSPAPRPAQPSAAASQLSKEPAAPPADAVVSVPPASPAPEGVPAPPPAPPPSAAQAPSVAVAPSPERTAVTGPASGDGAGAESSAPRSSGAVGMGGAGEAEPGARAGQGGSGSGGGLGSGVGARQGSAVALAVPGDGGGGAAEYAGYFELLRSRLHAALRYPTAARRRGLTGTVHVDLEIAPTGAIGNVVLARSSSHRLLDEAALEAVRALDRVPFPAGVRPRHLRVRLPVVFDLR